jgi:hypothetical protein
MKGTPWTEADDNVLRIMRHDSETYTDIALALDRSRDAVQQRAAKLGLTEKAMGFAIIVPGTEDERFSRAATIAASRQFALDGLRVLGARL